MQYEKSLAGKVAVITGASRGVGRCVAMRFAAEGAKVVLIGRPDAARRMDLEGTLDESAHQVEALGGRAMALRFDIGDPDADKTEYVREIEAAFHRAPDILVHCAAAAREWGPEGYTSFADMPFERFIAGVTTNVWGGWDLAKAMIPGMRRNGAGWIVFISSHQAAPRPHPLQPTRFGRSGGACVYGGTKAFIDRIVTGAASELFEDNIAVNSLAPTAVVSTPNSRAVGNPASSEPMEVFVEATLAMCTAAPKTLTSRVVHSMPLLAELNREVRTLDGAALFEHWQPDLEDERKFVKNYLAADGHLPR